MSTPLPPDPVTAEQDQKRGLSPDEWNRIEAASFRGGTPAWRIEVEQIIREHEAKAAYFAMWHFFLRLPFGPFSDMAQREAMRLRDLCPPVVSQPGVTS